MEDYEINILRRDGNWKKVKSKDLLLDTVDQNEAEYKHIDTEEKVPSEPLKEENFLNDINEVNTIIAKLEKLENDKTLLKNQLKIIEAKFQSKTLSKEYTKYEKCRLKETLLNIKDGEKDGYKCVYKRQKKGKDVTVFQPSAICQKSFKCKQENQ